MTLRRAMSLAALAVALSAGGAPTPKGSWIRMETANFTLYSNASESKTKEVALDLERFRALLASKSRKLRVNSPLPTSVFVFKNEPSMEPYKAWVAGKPVKMGGFFLSGKDGNIIGLLAGWNSDPRPIVYHEYFHYFMHNNFPPRPLFLDEGLAEYYSTVRTTEKEALIGGVPEHHVRLLRERPLLTLDRLFAIDRASPEYHEGDDRSIFYSESWALVHMIFHGEPQRLDELDRFLALLRQGKPTAEAFREAFHEDTKSMLARLQRYVDGSRFFYAALPFSGQTRVPPEVRVEQMKPEDVLCRLGELLAHEDEARLPEAEEHFRSALALSPEHGSSLAGLGLVRMRQRRYDEATSFFRRAIASDPKDGRVYFHYGELLLRPLADKPLRGKDSDEQTRETLAEARRALKKAVELSPDFGEGHAALGSTYLDEAEPALLEEGIAELKIARGMLPSRDDVARALAVAEEHYGRLKKKS